MGRTYPEGPKINYLLAIIGQMLPNLFPFDPLAFNLSIAREFGDVAYYHVGPLKVYQLNHPDLARQILVEQPEKFHKPQVIKRAFRPFAGNGLLTSDGALWRQQRKLIQPAFHHKHVATYTDVMVAHALRMVHSWEEGQVREINADMMKLTLGVVVKALFGADMTGEAEDVGELMTAVLDATNQRLNSAVQIPEWVPTRRNLREKRALAKLDAMLQDLIRTRRASGEDKGDLLSMLLMAVDEDSGARMSDQQLRDEMMTLFLAGHETTANALTWTWYLLSQNPEVEAKLLDELHRILGGRTPTVTDLPNLPYNEMVVREAIRLYPPAPGFTREPIEDINIGGYDVPKGSLVTVITYALHRDPRFFDDPETFEPERFAPGWEERIPRYAYLPFGGGPRVCIGNGFAMCEARLILATVAQRYQLTLEPDQEIVPIQLVTVRPKNGIRMRLRMRDPRARSGSTAHREPVLESSGPADRRSRLN
jgi:cytochrome P450